MSEKEISVFASKEIREQRVAYCIIIIILIALLAFSNMAWLYCWMQYDYETVYETVEETEIMIEADDYSNAIYQDGEGNTVNNGCENIEENQKDKN